MTPVARLAIAAALLAAPCVPPPARAAQLAQAPALAGEWSSTEPCAASANRLRFAGDTLAFFSGAQRASEYAVEIDEAGDRVSVRVVRVVFEPSSQGGLAPGARIQYRRDGETLRLVGLAMPGGQFMSPTVSTVYRRCK